MAATLDHAMQFRVLVKLRLTHVSVAWLTPLTHHSHPEPLKSRRSRLSFSGSESSLCGIPGNKGGEGGERTTRRRRKGKKKTCSSRFIKSLRSDTPYLSLDTIQAGVLTLVINEHRNSPPSSCSSNSTQEMLKELFSLWRCNMAGDKKKKKKEMTQTHTYVPHGFFWVMWLQA